MVPPRIAWSIRTSAPLWGAFFLPGTEPEQLALFAPPNPLVARLQGIDINSLTPLQALTLLSSLATEARGY